MLHPRQLIFESGNLLLECGYLMGVLGLYLFDPVKRLLLPCSGALPLGAIVWPEPSVRCRPLWGVIEYLEHALGIEHQ